MSTPTPHPMPDMPTTLPPPEPFEKGVRPRAWAIFVDNGNARMWSTLQPHVQKLADAEGLTITPLYDQAALAAAVSAERERIVSMQADGLAALIRQQERERCAKLCDLEWARPAGDCCAQRTWDAHAACAAAIRAHA